MRSKSYTIKVKPIAWQRAARNGSRYFDAQAKDKLAHGLYLINQHGDEPLFDKAIYIDIVFYMAIPKTLGNREITLYHTKSPDADNMVKFLFDAIKGVLITDDRIIYGFRAHKYYDKNPRTELTITEAE